MSIELLLHMSQLDNHDKKVIADICIDVFGMKPKVIALKGKHGTIFPSPKYDSSGKYEGRLIDYFRKKWPAS